MSKRQAAANKAKQGLLQPPVRSVGSVTGDKSAPSKIASNVPSKFAPKQLGKGGRPVRLKTNFFKIDLKKPENYYHYNIEIVPQAPGSAASTSAVLAVASASAVVSGPTASTAPVTPAPVAPAAQSGKPKGKGRKAAAAKKAGIDPSAGDSVASRPASTSSPTASPSSVPVASESSAPAASASGPAASASGPAASASGPAAKSSKSKRVPKQLHNDIFLAVFNNYPLFKCDYLPVFDGEKNFYSLTQFALPNNCWSGMVKVKNREVEELFQVNITVPDTSHYQNFSALLKRDGRLMPFELQALDILLRNGPRLNRIALGPNLFCKFEDPSGEMLRHKIGTGNFADPLKYIQFGFYQSSRRTEQGLYLNVDRAMAIFTRGGSLIELIDKIVPGASKTKAPLGSDAVARITEQIKGVKFAAKHLNFRTFTANGLTPETVKNQTFQEQEKTERSNVYDYFCEKYPAYVKAYPLNKFLPCVKYGQTKRPNYIPIECVQLLSNEVYRPKLKPIQQGDVTRLSSQQKPLDRFNNITKQISTIESDNTIQWPGKQLVNYLNKFGVGISGESAIVDARILDAPKLCYGKNSVVEPRNGQWMVQYEFYKPTGQPIGENWAVVNVGRMRGIKNRYSIPQEKVRDLIRRLIAQAQVKGIRQLSCPKTTLWDFNYLGKGTLENDLFKKLDPQVRFVVFLIPKDKEDCLYSEIKSVAELNKFGRGLATQCMLQEQKCWNNPSLFVQYLDNILLKINPKLGGTNQSIRAQDRPAIMKDKKTMFMGLDVTHPSPVGDNIKQSISAVVATYTDDFDKVFAKTKIQERGRKELINVKEITMELLESYRKVNGSYPEKIVVYRDGVGEGDFEKMVDVELGDMRKACVDLKANIKFTYIMVQKRHNTRFIPVNAKQEDKFQNIAPGTCVDSQITHSELFEFYLCSHAGMMGTSRPAKYVVLVDDNKLGADEIEKATYWFCHLYPRCTKTASIPPTVWFAHLLAERTRKYLAYHENSDARSSASSGSQTEVLSEAKRRELDASITVHPNLHGILHFI